MSKDDLMRMTGKDAVSWAFQPRRFTFDQRYRAFFTDYDMVPLHMQVRHPTIALPRPLPSLTLPPFPSPGAGAVPEERSQRTGGTAS